MKNIFYLMKPRLFLKLLGFVACYFICASVYSQKPEFCGGYKINAPELTKALEYEKANVNKSLTSTHYLMRVYFHIITDDNGSNAGATKAQVQTELNELVISYAPDNICFIKTGLAYINSSTLNTMHLDDASSIALLQSYNVPNCLNIYYHHEIVGAGGYAYSIPNTFCSIKTSNLGTFTTSHEVGHCFGLLHTFEPAYGYEDIDGSNGSSSADLVTDTHADPWVYIGQNCYPVQTCTYNGTCTDPKGQKNFSPPYYNTMCYWYVACGSYLNQNAVETPGQFTRINSFLNTNSDLLACESAANITFGPVNYSSGYVMTSALNSLTTSGAVNLSGTTIATLGGQTVFLENGFSAIPSSGGLISIEPSSCNFTFDKLADNFSSASTNNGKLLNSSKLIIYPNPTSSFVHLDFTTNKNESNVAIQVFNQEMKEVKEIRLGNLIKGKQAAIINLHNLSSGIYYMRLQLNNEYLNAKVVLIK